MGCLGRSEVGCPPQAPCSLADVVTNEFDVFISYARQDDAVVEPLVARLVNDNFSVWIDRGRLGAGDPLMDDIAKAIDLSAHTIACLSDAYVQRRHTMFELQLSRHRDPDSREVRTLPALLLPMTRPVPETRRTTMELGRWGSARYGPTVSRGA